MGAGKTTIGRLLASALMRQFVDSDQEIVKRTGVEIPVIFEIEGEPGFRRREREALRDLTDIPGIILATGGGAILAEENRLLLRERGAVVYLRALPRELRQRTKNSKSRPLLNTKDPLATLQELFEFRDPLYMKTAHFVIDTGRQSPDALVKQILKRLEKSEVDENH